MKQTQYLLFKLNIFILCIILFSCQSKDKVQIGLEKTAKSISQECPLQIDPSTRLDTCEVLPNRTIRYTYTMLLGTMSQDSVSFKEKRKKALLYKIQTNRAFEYMKNNNVSFIYLYKGTDDKIWGTIEISPEDYNQPVISNEEGNTSSPQQFSKEGKEEMVKILANESHVTNKL